MPADNAPEPGPDIFALARGAGLDRAVRQFPEDVVAAAQAAMQERDDLPVLEDVAAEPWPPMRTKTPR